MVTTPSTTTTTTTTTTASPMLTSISIGTTSSTTTISTTVIPPIQDQICVQSGIKDLYYSVLGQHYCRETCLNQPMDYCNLYICYCNTKYNRGF